MQRLNALAKSPSSQRPPPSESLHPAAAGMKVVDGQAYWTGDPGPVSPGAFYEGGQYKYDPAPLPELVWRHSAELQDDGARGAFGKQPLRLAQAGVNSNWEFHHPYIMVCD